MFTKLISHFLKKNQNILLYIKNTFWMLAENFLKILSAIFVNIYVARFLVPEQFGVISYAIAIISIFMVISRLGMDSILVRDITLNPLQKKALLSTSFALLLITSVFSIIFISILINFIENDYDVKVFIWIISSGIIFQSLLVIDYNFQAQVKTKFSESVY